MSIYKEYRREPSIPHQCMHHSNKHGGRCRGRAMHNEVMCFQHRIEDLPTVLQNDPFELTSLYDRAAIQHVVTQVAARLACNRIDLKRATLLLQSCQIAAANLTAHDRAANAKIAAPPLTPTAQELDPNPNPEALVRYQAYRAELGLDEEEENEDEPAATTPPKAESRPLTADSENPAPDNPQPETVLPTLNASATPNTARSAVHSIKNGRKAHAKRRERYEVPLNAVAAPNTARSAVHRTLDRRKPHAKRPEQHEVPSRTVRSTPQHLGHPQISAPEGST
jgi:hypothetical protein